MLSAPSLRGRKGPRHCEAAKRPKQSRMRILITSGPTQEPIDAVRYITNRSTGVMGQAIAQEAKRRGHKVTLISGPVPRAHPRGVPGIIYIKTANELFREVKRNFDKCDCLIMAAAVADFRPKKRSSSKITNSRALKKLELIPNPDILKWCGKNKKGKILIGFCLETTALLRRAKTKLKIKNLDLIVANQVGKDKDPFGAGKTEVLILDKNGSMLRLHADKTKIARVLLNVIARSAEGATKQSLK